ncbi:hypothetical protein [Streptomyces sp. NPDC057686]|uniref:nSTAND1 domain-containing NTPase n=1 Tax=Streptomyces sp. NPDC057686 TaxID=3346212 RepID=UPI0036A5C965
MISGARFSPLVAAVLALLIIIPSPCAGRRGRRPRRPYPKTAGAAGGKRAFAWTSWRQSFTAEHTRWFEGRTDAVRQVAANLARSRLTLILGPSGSGKSSLVQAGLLGALEAGEVPGSDRWLPVLARPRQELFAEIERAGLPGAATDSICHGGHPATGSRTHM